LRGKIYTYESKEGQGTYLVYMKKLRMNFFHNMMRTVNPQKYEECFRHAKPKKNKRSSPPL
jgi:hypothetical protein